MRWCIAWDSARQKLIVKVPGGAHLADVEQEIAAATQAAVGPWWIFTGNAQSIQTIKKTLRARRVSSSHLSTKAYWAYGKKRSRLTGCLDIGPKLSYFNYIGLQLG